MSIFSAHTVIYLKIIVYVCFPLITVAVIHHMMGMCNVIKHIVKEQMYWINEEMLYTSCKVAHYSALLHPSLQKDLQDEHLCVQHHLICIIP